MIETILSSCTNIHNFIDLSCRFYLIGIISLSAIGLYLYWLLMYKPPYFKREKTDFIGYNPIKEQYSTKNAKVDAINRFLRLRKCGDKIPPPFPNGWFCVALSSELKNGQVRSVDLLGQNLVVFRTESGVANVFDAYCPHLGAHLGIGGKVIGDCIECPFHLWSFRSTDGECVKVPYSTAETFPKSSKLKKWLTREVNEAIFIWHHAENAEPWELHEIEEISSGKWVYNGRNEFYTNCHIQEIPENGADVAHLNALHTSNPITGSDLRRMDSSMLVLGRHIWNASWKACEEKNKSHIASASLRHSFSIFNRFDVFPLDTTAIQYGPGIVELWFESPYGPFVMIQTVVPVEPFVQKVTHRIFTPNTLWMRFVTRWSLWGETVMFERDMMVWNSKRYLDNPCLVKEDKAIKAFRMWFSQHYSENSKSFQDARQTLDW